jgi:dTDP-4-amino-4,6-dideoxygalactose transaminase
VGRLDRRRRTLAALYRSRLAELGSPWIVPTAAGADSSHSYHLFSVLIDFSRAGVTRARVMSGLAQQGINAMVHYIPVCDQPYYEQLYGRARCEAARRFYQRQLSLPMHAGMTEPDVQRVVSALDQALRGGARSAPSE